MTLDIHRHPEAAAQRPSKDGRPQPGRRPPISGLPEIGTIARKSATADLRWLASRAPQGDGNESVLDAADTLVLAPHPARRYASRAPFAMLYETAPAVKAFFAMKGNDRKLT